MSDREPHRGLPADAMASLIDAIASGRLRGAAAFDAVVDTIAAIETPPRAAVAYAARIRDEVVEAVSHDEQLCALIREPVRAKPRVRPEALAERAARPKRSATRRPSRSPGTRDADAFGADFLATRRRNQWIRLGAMVIVGLALASLWWVVSRPTSCDALVREICLRISACELDGLRGELARREVSDMVCETAITAASDAADKVDAEQSGAVFMRTVIATVGFDPRGESAEPPSPPPEATAPAPLAIVSGQGALTSMFVDSAHVFFTVAAPPGVLRVSNIGGTAETLATTPGPTALTVTRDFVYWLSRDAAAPAIWVDKKRGQHDPVQISLREADRPASAVFFGAEFAYADATTGDIVIASVANEIPPRVLVAGPNVAPTELAGNDSDIVWVTGDEDGMIAAVSRTGGPLRTLAKALARPTALVLDATTVYFVEVGTATVAAAPLDGSGVRQLASGQAGPRALAVDDTRVYWTNADAGTVMAVAKAGGEPQALVIGQSSLGLVGVDAAAVYWEAAGAVYRLPK